MSRNKDTVVVYLTPASLKDASDWLNSLYRKVLRLEAMSSHKCHVTLNDVQRLFWRRTVCTLISGPCRGFVGCQQMEPYSCLLPAVLLVEYLYQLFNRSEQLPPHWKQHLYFDEHPDITVNHVLRCNPSQCDKSKKFKRAEERKQKFMHLNAAYFTYLHLYI